MGTWWKFWDMQSWRNWRTDRRAWVPYRKRAGQLNARLRVAKRNLETLEQVLATTERRIGWAEAIAPREVPVTKAKAEEGLAVVPGVRLFEIRKKDGKDVWTQVDSGAVYFTDRKMVFAGSRQLEFRYDHLETTDNTKQGLFVEVSSRKRAHTLAGPVEQLLVVLETAQAWSPDTDPAARYRRQREDEAESLASARDELRAIETQKGGLERPKRPVSPAWLPGTLLFLAIGSIGNLTAPDDSTQGQTVAVLGAVTSTTSAPATTSGVVITTLPQLIAAREPTTTEASAAADASDGTTTTTKPPTTTVTNTPTDADATPLVPGAALASVVSVTDGDTIRVRLDDGTEKPLRLIGINAPEGGECLSDDAAQLVTDLVSGQEVELLSDVSDVDHFGRLLRYVYVDGDLVNEALVREGVAIARRYEPDTAKASVLEAAQADAQGARRGMWAAGVCGPVTQASVVIGAVAYDAPGDDNTNLNNEWIQLTNTANEAVELGGWQVKDESASHRYSFPAGFVLRAGASLVLHTGCGTDTDTLVYWCNTGSAVWNNSGDTVFVLDPAGNIAAFNAYDASTPSAPPSTTTTLITTTTTVALTALPENCHPSYVPCVPIASDVDCRGGSGNGPEYTGRVQVVGPDVYGLDRDGDGIGCESS